MKLNFLEVALFNWDSSSYIGI